MEYRITQSRLLYVMTIDDRKHEGLLKIGEVFVDNNVADNPDKQFLSKAVREELDKRSYMSGVKYNIDFVECTTYEQNTKAYKADDVYRTLSSMGVASKALNKIDKEDADIWFYAEPFDALASVKKAISSIKAGKGAGYGAIKFRPEQEQAISETVKHFQKQTGKAFLWNAKMRFGKTLSGLEVAKRMGYKSTLIITHRPVVDDGWSKDFEKIFRTDEALAEYKKQGLEPAYGRRMMDDKDSHGNFYTLTKDVDNGKKILVFFVSMQYLRLSKFVGGKEHNFDPLKKAIMEYDWDFVMVDEAHEGIEAAAGVRVMDKLKKEKTRILSLSGTPFNLLDKYEEGEIYTWDYVMEQKAKQEWDDKHFGDPNPYADLPRMQILTFTLPKMVREEAIENNEVFKFHEFFRVWTEADRQSIQKLMDNETNPVRKDELKSQLDGIVLDKFIHEGAVRSFVKKLRTTSTTSQYPFSTDEFRDKFRHTFWLLPGVKEAAALEQILREDKVFGKADMFHIINAAGDGNIEDKDGSALADVEDNIRGNQKKNIKAKKRTITLSCGKLTTGVSVPEWTAVLCMKGSENTPAANYMQTIFRVQTHATLNGRQKSDCYVFDFAPDRALTAVAETAKMAVYAQTEKGKGRLKLSQQKEEEHLAAFIKLCPVLSMDEGEMGKHFSANQIFEKLSNVYIERAVRSGYADNSLYNPEQLMNLTPEQEKALGDVHDLLGSLPASWKPEKIGINKQGIGEGNGEEVKYIYFLTGKDTAPVRPTMAEEMDENGRPTTDTAGWDDIMNAPTQVFPYLYVSNTRLIDGGWTNFSEPTLWKEWIDKDANTDEAKKKREAENKEKRARMSVLRGVSIRIPLLVYGAEINDDAGEEITIDNFASDKIVDDASWEEFMPKGFTKATFNILKDCFDRSIFTGAAKRIRQMVKEADNLSTEDRINKIATIFSYFHNPDKETVLTPWRVVNMHMSDCLGGWCFLNEQFDGNHTVENEYGENVNAARFVDRGQVTKDIFTDYNARILEINSKTGLYPLYMAYSMFKGIKEPEYRKHDLTGTRGASQDAEQYYRQAGNDLEIWKDVLQENIFVVCRTKMAVSITKRTLAGFRTDIKMNVKCYEHKIDVNDMVSAGIIKADDEGVTKIEKTFFFNGEKALMCDMINVLRAKPELFLKDIVQGMTFWGVNSNIQKKHNEDLNNMKFSAIVGNPPYQQIQSNDTNLVNRAFASALYPKFIEAARKLSPTYISMITPSRWMTKTGQGISLDWVDDMLNCNHITVLHDYLNASDCFTGVEIKGGVSYFLYESNNQGKCLYNLHFNGNSYDKYDYLNSTGAGVVIRDINAISIINKIKDVEGDYYNTDKSFMKIVGPVHLFDKDGQLGTRWNGYKVQRDSEHNIKFYLNKKVEESGFGWISRTDIPKGFDSIDVHKVYIPEAGGSGTDALVLGKPFYGEPGSVCSETYLCIGFDKNLITLTKEECYNVISYINTRFFRYLVSIKKKTQHATASVYQFVPILDFSTPWTDNMLFEKYHLSDDEKKYICDMIKPISQGEPEELFEVNEATE